LIDLKPGFFEKPVFLCEGRGKKEEGRRKREEGK